MDLLQPHLFYWLIGLKKYQGTGLLTFVFAKRNRNPIALHTGNLTEVTPAGLQWGFFSA